MKKTIVLLFSALLFMGVQSSFAQCDISGPGTILTGETETFSTTGTSSYNYFWSVTGVLNIVGNNNSPSVDVTANSDGDGTICVTRFKAGEEPCCECTDIKVEDPPMCTPATSISVSQIEVPGNGCPGDIIQFVASIQPSDADVGFNSFYWEAGTDFIISNPFFQQTGGSSVYIDTPDGENSVWIRVTFTSCDGSTVTALTLVTWEISCFRGLTPTLLKASPNTSIVPNPFSDYTQLNIAAEEEVDAEIEIFNINGQVIYSKAAHLYKGKNEITFDQIPNDSKGVLYYRIKSTKGILGYGEMLRID